MRIFGYQPTVNHPRSNLVKSDMIVSLCIFLMVMIIHGWLAFYWYDLSVFDQFNVIYDADPSSWLKQHSDWHYAGSFTHPLLTYYASIPISLVAEFFSILGLDETESLKKTLGVWVSPICSSIKAVLIYLTFRGLGLHFSLSLILTSVGVLSFSSLVFGSIPSSYPVTGMMSSAVIFFLVFGFIYVGKFFVWGLFVAGFFSIGTTLSNVISVGWALWAKFVKEKGKPFQALSRSVLVSFFILCLVLVTHASLFKLRIDSYSVVSSAIDTTDFINGHTPDSSQRIEKFLRFPEMAARTYLATEPQKEENILYKKGDLYDFELTYNTINWGWSPFLLWLITAVSVVGGFVKGWIIGGVWRLLVTTSALTFVTYWLLYSYFGYNTYLYSQHWQVAQLFLIAPWFVHGINSKKAIVLLSTCTLLLMITLNFNALNVINQFLVG